MLISIPLGIAKAVRDGSRFDVWTSSVIIVGYAIPSFLFAIFLIVLFCGGSFWQIFPLRGLTSENFAQLSLLGKIKDYFWHITLPVTALTLGAFATVDLSHQEFLPRRNPQAICADRADEGPERAARALRPCLSQCDDDRGRGISRRVHQCLLRRLAADRNASSRSMVLGFCPMNRSSIAIIRSSSPISIFSRCSALS